MLPIALLSLIIWVYLLAFHGQFWRTDQQLEVTSTALEQWPTIAAVIPARNEAEVIAQSLGSLLAQDYPGQLAIYLVDDQSSDGTATIATQTAKDLGKQDCLKILTAKPLPAGWTGKLWALAQGVAAVTENESVPDYILLTDADIEHDRENLKTLVIKAEREQRHLVSLMVKLRCESNWEKLLIPAFVFFFAKLYPFRRVNQPQNPTAAAAGGCSLVKTTTLQEMGGIAALKDALIDDCTLAYKIKHSRQKPYRNIWLGLTQTTKSLRPYDGLESIWDMVARTAYTQLNYSPWLLIGTIFGMYLVYLQAPIGILTSLWRSDYIQLVINLMTYGLMAIAYRPIVQFYQINWVYSLCLPWIGLLYTGMTLDSARRHWQGKGGAWKGRTY
jgi:hopene-associated glycosyltransferase HpnB